jgi:hypothetical protein
MVDVAQLVEHQIVALVVEGSIPSIHPILRSFHELRMAGHSFLRYHIGLLCKLLRYDYINKKVAFTVKSFILFLSFLEI